MHRRKVYEGPQGQQLDNPLVHHPSPYPPDREGRGLSEVCGIDRPKSDMGSSVL